MKKLLLSFAATVLLMVPAHAQIAGVVTDSHLSFSKADEVAMPAQARTPRKITLESNQALFGSYTSDQLAKSGSGLPGYSTTTTATYSIAQIIPARFLDIVNGFNVVKMRFGLTMDQSRPCDVFIIPINTSGTIGDIVASGTCSNPKAGWNEVTLTQPYTINTDEVGGIILGFTYTQSSANNGQYYNTECYPLSILDLGPFSYSIIIKGLNNGYNPNTWYGMGDGILGVQAVVEGDLPTVAANVLDFNSVVVSPGQTVESPVIMHNTGKTNIKSIQYVIVTDGVDGEEQTLQLSTPATMLSYAEIKLSFPAADQEGTQRRSVSITKINGKSNESTAPAGSGLVATTSRTVKHRVAVEEFTGTGCGYCPRGIVGMEKLRAAFPDEFVGIGIHQYNSGDAMYLPDYPALGFTGAPSCMLDRLGETDPYHGSAGTNFGIKDDFASVMSMPAKAGLEVSGEWNEDGTAVVATATIESLVGGADYDIEFCLIADSLYGTGTGWNQSNYYYQYTAKQVGTDLAPFAKNGKYGKSSVSGLRFNDVAIATSYLEGKNQADPVLAAPDDTTVQATYTIALPTTQSTNKAVLKSLEKKNVAVVALLVDSFSGTVVNAAKSYMPVYVAPDPDPDPEPDSISTLQTPVDATARFAPDGRQLTSPRKGLNIVRMSDGSTRKLYVR